MKKNVEILQKLAEELFSLMGTDSKLEVSYDKENEAYVVNVVGGDETGLLIGRRGETLTSIQTVLGLLMKQKIGDWVRVMLNVGDYREKEEDYLKSIAEQAATRAVETGEGQPLYNLKPAQRRIIHMYLSEKKDIQTESLGEGPDRYLVVKPK